MKDGERSGNKHVARSDGHVRFLLTVLVSTVLISGLFSLAANALLSRANILLAFCVLLIIVLIGIVFDIIGVAVTAADEKPFHAMASHRVMGAKEALAMLKKADRVSSFCNDVIGDICGIVSGTASASIAALAITGSSPGRMEILLAAIVSGVTVGGKAFGKRLAIRRSTEIVHLAAGAVYWLKYLPRRFTSRPAAGKRKNRGSRNGGSAGKR